MIWVKKNFTHIYYAAPGNVKGKKHIYAEIIIFLLLPELEFQAITIPRLIQGLLAGRCFERLLRLFDGVILRR